MISLDDYTSHDGLGLAELVARKEVTPDELAAAAFEAVAKINPRINAVLQTLPKEAAAEIRAGLPHGPFTGVPFMIKELVLHAKGVRADSGSKFAQGFVPSADTELMARFRRAGLVLAGTTQTPEFGYNPTTETRAFGPVHNPWDLGRSAGGSSGGSGAAVAARIVPSRTPTTAAARSGSRPRATAWSVSSPRAIGCRPAPIMAILLCGLAMRVRVDPQRARRGRAARRGRGCRYRRAGPSRAARPSLPRAKSATAAGTVADRMDDDARRPASKIDPECVEALQAACDLLEETGPYTRRGSPALRLGRFLENMHVIWTAFTAASVDALAAGMKRKPGPDNLEAVTLACYEDGKRYGRLTWSTRWPTATWCRGRWARFFENVDVLVTPDYRPRTGAARRTESGPQRDDRDGVDAPSLRLCRLSRRCSIRPVSQRISLPLHWSAGGLPVGRAIRRTLR